MKKTENEKDRMIKKKKWDKTTKGWDNAYEQRLSKYNQKAEEPIEVNLKDE